MEKYIAKYGTACRSIVTSVMHDQLKTIGCVLGNVSTLMSNLRSF